MNYTEKERKGIDKVADMNRFFDKILLPAVGVLIIITLLVFIVGRVRTKFGGGGIGASHSTSSVSSAQLQKALEKRETLLGDYETNAERWAEGGYVRLENYEGGLALERKADGELSILQIADDVLGGFTTLTYRPSDGKAKYKMLSLTVMSGKLFTVTLSGEGFDDVVTFPSPDFRKEDASDREACDHMMRYVTQDDLQTLYEIFLTDMERL